MTLRVAIVGTGRRGQLYLTHLLRRGNVAVRAVCDVNHRAAAAAGHMSRARVYTRYELVLLHEGLDALIVASPASYHPLIAADAVQRGLHVFLAPPLAATIPAGRRLVRQVGQSGAFCALDYAVRYEPDVPPARTLLAARPITRLAGRYRLPSSEINPARAARSSDLPPPPPPELLDTWELLAGRVRVMEPAPSRSRNPALHLQGVVAGVVTGTMSLTTPWELVVEVPAVKVTITPAALSVATAAGVRRYSLDPMRALDTFLEAVARRAVGQSSTTPGTIRAALADDSLIRTAPETMLRPLALALAAGEVLEQPRPLVVADVLAREEPPPRRWPWRQLARWLDFLWH